MKKIFTTLLIVFTVTLCKAQWVTIPDANFVNWLNTHGYSSCMNGTMMDTTCSVVVNATSVTCSFQLISNLTGIQYFNSLTYLDCHNNSLTSLPILPNSLSYLICHHNLLTSLPSLPNTLTWIDCFLNSLTSLPALPNSIYHLQCEGNSLTSLPTLPSSLTKLICHSNSLTSLPTLPGSLTELQCQLNSLTNLPSLPNSLTNLYCYNNLLTSLPLLPGSLTHFDCKNNLLTSLPSLPGSLPELRCSSNSLTSLPSLPGSLTYIDCAYNSLTSLPSLPGSLNYLLSNNNSLTSLPLLPGSLIDLWCFNNSLTSLPLLPGSLLSLRCHFNSLTSLPDLPLTLSRFTINNNSGILCMPALQNFTGPSSDFNISNTGITCLPNAIQHTGYIASIDTMPICSCVYPSGISTSNITSTSAKINWSTECCSQFQIQKRVTGTTTWSTVTAVATATSKNLTALTPGTTYDLRMRVKCTDATTYSSWSPIQTFTTLVTCVAPSGISVSNLTQTHATINWAAVVNAYSYKLQGRKLGTTAWTSYTIIAPLTVKQLNGLTANTTYQYRMQTVCNASGVPTSPWTAISTFSTPLRMEDESMENASIDFSIYPNPVSEQLTVNCNQLTANEIEVQDLLGRVLINQQASSESSTTIDVSNLSAAQYFISIRRNDGSVLIKQFVKE